MKCTKELIVVALFFIQVHISLAGKSTDKCNEYIELSREKRDVDESRTVRSLGKITTKPGEFPHMAALRYGKDHEILCGGVLISDQYVLTSAVCTRSAEHGEVKNVRLGDRNIKSDADDADVQEFNVAEIITHPEYKAPSAYNDIALLKLDQKVNFTKKVRPACLQTEQNLSSDTVIGTGWGLVDFLGLASDELLKVTLEVYTNEECNTHYENARGRKLKNGITDKMLCAGGRTEPKSTCQGDSGGPLQVLRSEGSNMYNVVGIISFGRSCGVVNSPEVATRVSSYVSWIESIAFP